MRRVVLLGVVCVLSVLAGDWLNRGGDPQHSGWQQHGKTIHAGNAGQIQLLWKQKLDAALTAPVMLGPIVTHRGIKELVFVGGVSNSIFAVDADLGRVFWKREIAVAGGDPCPARLTAAPAMAPLPESSRPNLDDDEWHSPMRPFYFVSGDGILHTIRPADGVDMAPARTFVPARANLSALTFVNGFVYAATSNSCGGVPDGLWGVDVAHAESKPLFVAAKAPGGVSVDTGGRVYAPRENGVEVLVPGTLKPELSYSFAATGDAPILFPWNGRTVLLAGSAAGGIALLDRGKVTSHPAGAAIHGLATSMDAGTTRWIYASVDKRIAAFRVVESNGAPTLAPAWISDDIGPCLAPVIANGIVYALAEHTLYAVNAATGKVLYSSGDAIISPVHSSALAVANGHITFATDDGTLYCFGLPLQID